MWVDCFTTWICFLLHARSHSHIRQISLESCFPLYCGSRVSQSYVSQKCVTVLCHSGQNENILAMGDRRRIRRALESRPTSTELSLPRQRKGGLYPYLHPHLKEENMFQIWFNIRPSADGFQNNLTIFWFSKAI